MKITQNSWSSLLHSEIISHLTIPSVRISLDRSPRRCRRILRSLAVAPTLLFLLLAAATAFGGSATWNLNPSSGDWNIASNWTPATVPDGPTDTATFDVSNLTGVYLDAFAIDVEVDGIVFNPGASAFTLTLSDFVSFPLTLTISGAGITNNSGIPQNFVINSSEDFEGDNALILFTNSATAGDLTVFTNIATGSTKFFGMSSAGSGDTFINNGSGGFITESGTTGFFDNATANNATLIANGGSVVGGTISFGGDSTGGTSRVETFGNGKLDISGHSAPGVTVGSIEGDGLVSLGANNLTVGTNNLSTTFSGVIQDGGVSGSLTKVGTGKLILTNVNTYNGGTTINDGTLVVNSTTDSSTTGSGGVQVNAGVLGGVGKITGAVMVGTGSGSGAILSPGINGPGTLAITKRLTFNADATYRFRLNSSNAKATKVVTKGVTINSGALFSFTDVGSGSLIPGAVFGVINNTAATPIAGTFANLADGSTFTVNANTFQVSYEGGTGNDLTLTVQ